MRLWLYHSNLLIAGVAVCYVAGTAALLGTAASVPLLLLVGAGTFLVYQADRFRSWSPEDQVNQPDRVQWGQAHRSVLRAATGVAVVLGGVALSQLSYALWAWAVVVGAAGVLQVVPVLPGRRRLKYWSRLKPFWLSGVWAVGAVGSVVVEAGLARTWEVGLLVLYRMALVLPNALVADWPDRQGDAAAGLRTWAIAWGERRLVGVGRGVLAGVLLAGGAAVAFGGASWVLGIDLLGYALLYALLRTPLPEGRGYYVLLDALLAWPVFTFAVWAGL